MAIDQPRGARFTTLEPTIKHIPQTTIRKKWKPLPQSSQDKLQQVLLSLKARRGISGRNTTISARPRPRKGAAHAGNGTKKKPTTSQVQNDEYERAVEEVADK
jgi:hypothetical protein